MLWWTDPEHPFKQDLLREEVSDEDIHDETSNPSLNRLVWAQSNNVMLSKEFSCKVGKRVIASYSEHAKVNPYASQVHVYPTLVTCVKHGVKDQK